MSFEELAAALEERLYFYKTVLEMMENAVKTGDTAAIEAYSRLESRTAEEIAAHRKCFVARQGESPRAGEHARKIETALEDAHKSLRRVRTLLAREKDAVAAQIQAVRRKKPASPRQENAPLPLVIDMEA